MGTKGVLIVGGSGFVGTRLALRLRESYRVITTYHSRRVQIPGVLSLPLDFREEAWMRTIIYRFRPEVIIYLAATQDFEWIDKNLPAAEKIIANGPSEVMRVADLFQPRLIFVSSAYVFDGSRGNYTEKDSLTPYNNFGKLKAGAENFVRGRAGIYTLIRSAALLGCGTPHRPSFIDHLRSKLSRGERLEVQNYELHNFGSVDGLASMIDQAIQTAPRRGMFHYGGLTRLSHYEVAVRFARRHGFDEKLLIPRTRTGKVPPHLLNARTDFSLNFTEAVNTLQVQPQEVDEIIDSLHV